ncbi:hypothetical protein, partial [Sphingobium yanoikuyae]|uniref:hypothetical protein n=1 Tax=Sphingobium yanoikuyae TaxID=13690 RepID=UPI001BDF2C34
MTAPIPDCPCKGFPICGGVEIPVEHLMDCAVRAGQDGTGPLQYATGLAGSVLHHQKSRSGCMIIY